METCPGLLSLAAFEVEIKINNSSDRNTSLVPIKCEPDIDFGIEDIDDIDIDEMIPNVEEFYGFSADGGNLSIQDTIQSECFKILI